MAAVGETGAPSLGGGEGEAINLTRSGDQVSLQIPDTHLVGNLDLV